MHKFLRAVGFSQITKRDFEHIIQDIVEYPDVMKISKDSEKNEFIEFKKTYGDGIGIIVRGTSDEENQFCMEYYLPFAEASLLTTEELVDVEKHAEKESYAGVCDEVRLGVTLIFYIQNVADYLSEYRVSGTGKNMPGAMLSALSVGGKILLPIHQKKDEKQISNSKKEKRNQLIEEAREGNEKAIEILTVEDMDTYTSISKRIQKEDLFTIVQSSFMPYGIESDHYSIIAEILDVKEVRNSFTDEIVYYMKVECNDIVFQLAINQQDLMGEPAIGRRFKGSIWMQGNVCL